MEKVILITCDKCTKKFQVIENLSYVAKNIQSATHLLTFLAYNLANRGERINNIKMKNINVFDNNC